MNTKVVYVLACGPEDCYFEQFLLSLHSLKSHDPGCEVEVVLDPESYGEVLRWDEPLLEGIRLTQAAVPPGYDGLRKSRYLKTRLRSLVDGDYLYIDTDTLISAPLADIDGVDADLAAVSNENGLPRLTGGKLLAQCIQAGFPNLKNAPFYNGGVFFVRDSDVSRRFYDCWHKRWLQSLENGVPYDQPALCQANLDTGRPIRELSGGWNCQICSAVGPHYFKDAKVIHYYGSVSWLPENIILPHVKKTGELDPVADEIARDPKGRGIAYYHPSHFGKLKLLFSHLLFRLTKCPPAFLFIQNLAILLGRPAAWIRKRLNEK